MKSEKSVVGRIRPVERNYLPGVAIATTICGAVVELPESLPLDVRVFLGWVAIDCWEEAALTP